MWLRAALHRIAITQLAHHPDARAFRDRRVAGGDTGTEALRALKRRLSDVVFRSLLADASRSGTCLACLSAEVDWGAWHMATIIVFCGCEDVRSGSSLTAGS